MCEYKAGGNVRTVTPYCHIHSSCPYGRSRTENTQKYQALNKFHIKTRNLDVQLALPSAAIVQIRLKCLYFSWQLVKCR